jgi:hypothetical protein
MTQQQDRTPATPKPEKERTPATAKPEKVRTPAAAKRQKESHQRRRVPLWMSIPAGLVALWLLGFGVVYWVETGMTSPETRAEFHFYSQLLTGNWSNPIYENPDTLEAIRQHHPGDPRGEHPWRPHIRLAASISTAFLLNLVSLGLLAWLLKRVRDLPKENAMILKKISWKTVIESYAGDVVGRVYPALNKLRDNGDFTPEQIAQVKELLSTALKEGEPLIINVLSAGEAERFNDTYTAPVAESVTERTRKKEGPHPS